MNMSNLKQAWSIWLLPLIILQLFVMGIMLFFISLKAHIQSNRNAIYIAENMITFALGGAILTAWYIVLGRYERIKQAKVRKITKFFWKFFVCVYIIYTIIIIFELIKELS